ncbi:MAG: hypothetical protein LIP11_13490 [Clostridiales bacterium]|nr:hypothetical protein [Clostridiales bacterium]
MDIRLALAGWHPVHWTGYSPTVAVCQWQTFSNDRSGSGERSVDPDAMS